jgi:hypothetical protein
MSTEDAAGNGAEASELDKKAEEAKNVLSTVTNLGQAIFSKVNHTENPLELLHSIVRPLAWSCSILVI